MSKACHQPHPPAGEGADGRRALTIALAGNPNVGKSTLFNALTGLGVSTAHFPGTTREVQLGTVEVGDRTVSVLDLPGTYSLGGTSEDSVVARAAIAEFAPDVIVVVADPATLARNLHLAIEVLDRGLPVVVAMNLMDEAKRSGLTADIDALAGLLGVPVVATVATRGVGVETLVRSAIDAASCVAPSGPEYGPDFEALLEPLVVSCADLGQLGAAECRVKSLAMLEGRHDDGDSGEILSAAESVRVAMRGHFGEDAGVHLIRERHAAAGIMAEAVLTRTEMSSRTASRDLWNLTTSPVTGVPLVLLVAAAVFGFLFFVGEFLASAFSGVWEAYASPLIAGAVGALAGDGAFAGVLLWGFDAGIEASLAIGLPYILTFYFLMGLLEDGGYLNSLSFLTDRVMHRFGLHGRAIVPLVAAAGCNVPALMAANQLSTRRERRIASTLVLFVPCSARTAVILGSVGHYVGWQPALMVFGLVFAIGLAIALTLGRVLPGESKGLVMEMFGFRRPSLRRVAAKAWEQFREFLFVATPIVVAGSMVLGGLYESGWLARLSEPFSAVVEGWLGLPAFAGVTLIVGILRKELALQLLVALAIAGATVNGAGLMDVMSPTDVVVYALVNAVALPCISSVAVYWRKQGWKATVAVIGGGVGVALLVGGIASRVLALAGFGS